MTMEKELPEGWVETKLDVLATDVSYGYTASSTDSPIGPQMLRITDIQDGKVNWGAVPYCGIEEDKKLKYLLKKGDLVFARTGATVGKSFLIKEEPPESVYASYLIRVRVASSELTYLLAHFFNSDTYWRQITEFSAGIGQPNVNGTKLKGLTVPLPPLAEQQVIADTLDALLAQVETTKTRLERVPETIKRFRQSVLAAAVSGKLTEEWREINASNYPFNMEPLGNLIDEMRNGLSAKPNETGSGFPILRISSVRSFLVDQSDIRFLEVTDSEVSRYCLKKGDLLFTRYNGSLEFVGVCGLIENLEFNVLLYPDKLIRVRVDQKKILPKYLEIFSASFQAREYIESLIKSTSGQKGISGKDLKLLKVSLPSLEEQAQIVRRVEELFAHADAVEQQAKAALEKVNNLTQSILAKAFRGELTADWRAANPELISGENSAEALLARIKEERAAQKPKKRATTRRKKKAVSD